MYKLGDNNEYFTVIVSNQQYGIIQVYESGVLGNPKFIETKLALGALGETKLEAIHIWIGLTIILLTTSLLIIIKTRKNYRTRRSTE